MAGVGTPAVQVTLSSRTSISVLSCGADDENQLGHHRPGGEPAAGGAAGGGEGGGEPAAGGEGGSSEGGGEGGSSEGGGGASSEDDGEESRCCEMRAVRLPRNVQALVQLACGGRHCVASTEDGRVVTWGSREGCRLGRPVRHGASVAEHAAPAVVAALEEMRVSVVSAAANSSVALDATGRLWTWGMLSDGEREQPEEVRPPADDENFARHFVQACVTEWYTLVGVTVGD